jgi:hypothetical protein
MIMRDFERVEILLNCLLEAEEVFSNKDEINEVRDFISHGEYGIALDLIVATAVEDKRPVPKEWLPIIRELTQAMELESDKYLDRISNLVSK